jgi:hypothetical protein
VTPRCKTLEERRPKTRTRWTSAANDTEVTKGNQQQGKRKRLWEADRLEQPQINDNTTNYRGGGSCSSTNYTRQLVRSADTKKKEVKKGVPTEWGKGCEKEIGKQRDIQSISTRTTTAEDEAIGTSTHVPVRRHREILR